MSDPVAARSRRAAGPARATSVLLATAARAIRHEWRHGRLSLAGLDRPSRALAWLAMAAGAGAALVILASGAGVALPLGADLAPGPPFAEHDHPVAVPRLVVLLLLGGLAVGAAALASAVPGRARPYRWATAALLGLAGAAVGAQLVKSADLILIVEGIAPPGTVEVSTVARAAGWLAIAAASSAFLALGASPSSLRWLASGLAAGPYLLALAVYAASGLGASAALTPEAQAADPSFPPVLTAQALAAIPGLLVASDVQLPLVALGYWQAVAWARATRRDIGLRAGRLARRWPELLGLLVGLKLAWLALGYLGLPGLTALGLDAPAWAESRADGPLEWGLALALAALAGWWLASARRFPVTERGFGAATWLLAGGFSAWFVVGSLLVLVGRAAQVVPEPRIIETIASLVGTITENGPLSQVFTFALAGLVGLALLRRGDRSPALFLLVAAAWAAPRAVTLTRELIIGETVASSVGHVELATLDTAVTLVIAVLAAAWERGRQTAADLQALTLVLVVSTLLAHGGTLVPAGWSAGLFYLALVFPLAYGLLFDSEALNAPGADRSARGARVLRSLGLQAAVLALVATAVAMGWSAPGSSLADEAGKLLFAVPFTVLLVAAAISASDGRSGDAAQPTPAP